MVLDLGVPLGADVLVRSRRNNRKANQKDVSLGVREGTKTIVILLTGGIPETQVDGFAVNHDVGGVVVEDSGDVFTWREREKGGRVRERNKNNNNNNNKSPHTILPKNY